VTNEAENTEQAALDKLTGAIIGCIIKVHKTLGPGYAESVYRSALVIELNRTGLTTESEKELTIQYEGQTIGHHTLDVVVDNQVVLELMTVESLAPVHYARMRSYLRAVGLEVGLLVNFAQDRPDFRRVEL